MTDEFNSALALIRNLDERFPGSQTLIVGGAVRDFLLDVPMYDVDIATNIPFDDLINAGFSLQDITKNTVNPQPVSVISHDDFVFEIAAFRADSAGVLGRANNVATTVSTFEEDSARRDITINAMGIDGNKNIVDPQGGSEDLRNGLIRAVGNANIRFAEDATRILRVIRFASTFDFVIVPDTWTAIWNNKNRLTNREEISPESIAKEIFKVAKNGPALAEFVDRLCLGGIIDIILPEFGSLYGFMHDPAHHPEGGSTVIGHILECLRVSESNDPVVNIAILFHDLGKAVTRGEKENGYNNYHGHEAAGVPIVQGIFDRLKFNDLSSDDKYNILFAVERHMLIHNIDELSIKTLSKLVLSSGWGVLRAVGLADEKSRGELMFVRSDFDRKISEAEVRVANIAVSAEDLRLKVTAYVNGNMIMDWFPVTRENRKLLRPLLERAAEYIIDAIDRNYSPTEADIKFVVACALAVEL